MAIGVSREWRPAPVITLVVLLLASVALAAVFIIHSLQSTVSSTGQPLIWYSLGTLHGMAAVLGPGGQAANLSGSGSLAYVLVDRNTSLSGLAVLGLDGIATGSYVNVSSEALVLNATLISDPDGYGLVLLLQYLRVVDIIQILGTRTYIDDRYWGFLVMYSNRSLEAVLAHVATLGGTTLYAESQSCRLGLLPPGQPLRVNVTILLLPSQEANVSLYLDGSLACTALFNLGVGVSNVDYSFTLYYAGSPSTAAEYSLSMDEYRFWFKNDTARGWLYENYDDGVYAAPWTVAYNGSGVAPFPGDGSIVAYLAPLASATLGGSTVLPNGTLVYVDPTGASGGCSLDNNGKALPVLIVEHSGFNLTDYPVRIELNATNFADWDLLSPTGSDIYFTDTYGNPLRYWVAYIDTVARRAVLYVEVPSLPPYSEETVYMHYGGSNLYPGYNTRSIVVLFYDPLNYTSLAELLASGNWVVVDQSSIIAVNETGVYIANADNNFVMRTVESFKPPLIVRFDLAACRSASSDWDSGIAIGWDDTTNYVAYLDDIGNTGYASNYMAITEGLASPSWVNDDFIDQPRLDNDYTAFHTYAAVVLPDNDTFIDLTDGRTNWDNYYTVRALVQNYGNISGYIWLVNDGDTGDNCAIYRRVAVTRQLPANLAPWAVVARPLEPRLQAWEVNASRTSWPIWASASASGVSNSGIGVLRVNASAAPNLTLLTVYGAAPPGASCRLHMPLRYGVSGGFSLSLELPVAIEFRP